jgi:predicted DNA-binding transcriptional regulator YafY
MSLNKHASIRYRAIDECLSNNKRTWNIEDIHKAVNNALNDYNGTQGIEIRQLRADIAFMKDEKGHSAPIEHYRDGKRHLYRYTEKDFSISNKGINSGEAEIMGEAVRFLSSFRGRPGFEMLDEIVPVMEDKLGVKDLNKNFISYGDNIDYKGYSHIGRLRKAIQDKLVLEIEYKPFNKPKSIVKLHPYHIKGFNNRYFLFGLNKESDFDFDNLALDRIEKISSSKVGYVESDNNWNEYFDDIVGVSNDEKVSVETIKLKIAPNRYPYVVTKPLHSSQVIPKDEPEGIVLLKVKVNRELKQMLYSFGGDVEVLEPASLREEMKEEAEKMLTLYK